VRYSIYEWFLWLFELLVALSSLLLTLDTGIIFFLFGWMPLLFESKPCKFELASLWMTDFLLVVEVTLLAGSANLEGFPVPPFTVAMVT